MTFNSGRRDEHRLKWYVLDNAARIFPGIVSRRYTSIFRLSAMLSAPVSASILNRSIEAARTRFPQYFVRARQGFFWQYLEENPRLCEAAHDLTPPCASPPKFGSNRFLFQFRARGDRVALEISHLLTDGTGAIRFLQAILMEYLIRRHGLSREAVARDAEDLGLVHLGQDPEPEEEAYSYRDWYAKDVPPPVRQKPAWHLTGSRLPIGHYHVTTAIYSAAEVRQAAQGMGSSVTDLLIGAVVDALQQEFRSLPARERRRRRNWAPIRLLIPVNLRPTFGSRTMRNFFAYAMVELDQRLGEYEFDEVVSKVHHQLRTELDSRSLRRHLARNVKPELNFLVRVIPVVLKDMILKLVFYAQGDRLTSGSFSNLGRVSLPTEVESYVRRFDFVPPPAPVTGANTTLITYGDKLSLTVGSSLTSHRFERAILARLASLGLRGTLRTNWGREP